MLVLKNTEEFASEDSQIRSPNDGVIQQTAADREQSIPPYDLILRRLESELVSYGIQGHQSSAINQYSNLSASLNPHSQPTYYLPITLDYSPNSLRLTLCFYCPLRRQAPALPFPTEMVHIFIYLTQCPT